MLIKYRTSIFNFKYRTPLLKDAHTTFKLQSNLSLHFFR